MGSEEGWKPIHFACKRGDLDEVKTLLKAGGHDSVDVPTADLSTPLLVAALEGHANVVRYLMEMKADIQRADAEGETSLHRACKGGNTDVVALLLDAKASRVLSSRASDGKTPLHLACENEIGRPELVSLLLDAKASQHLDAKTDKYGSTPLHSAVYGDVEIVKLLLEKKAKIDAPSTLKHTPLWLAARIGSVDVAKFLLDNKASVEGHQSALKRLAKMKGGKRAPLLVAVEFEETKIVQLLLDHKASTECKNRAGRTPLMIAANSRETPRALSELLLQHGAIMDAETEHGDTAISIAKSCNNTDFVQVFRKHKRQLVRAMLLSYMIEDVADLILAYTQWSS